MKWAWFGLMLFSCYLLGLSYATGQVDQLFSKDPNERITWLRQNSVWRSRDSVTITQQLDSVFTIALKRKDYRLAWYAELQKMVLSYYLQIEQEREVTAFEDYRVRIEACPVREVKAVYWYYYGYHCFRRFRFEEAMPLLFRAKSEFDQIGFSNIPLSGEYLSGYGDVYYSFGDYPGSIRFLEAALHYPMPTLRMEIAALNSIGMAYQRLGNYEKARHYINLSLPLSPSSWRTSYPANYYEVLALYYQKKKDYRLQAMYTDSLIRLKDSLQVVFSSKILSENENLINTGQYRHNLESIEKEKQNAIFARNLIIGTLLLLFASCIYALNLKRQKLTRERQAPEKRQKRTDDLLAYPKMELQQYISNLNGRTGLVGKISPEPGQPRTASGSLSENALPVQVDMLLEKVILTEKDWQQFKHLFEQVHHGFFDSLKTKFPDLTPAEIRLLALIKLSIPTKDMAHMLGVSMDAIRKSRYRLRKKFENSGSSTDLGGLIEEL